MVVELVYGMTFWYNFTIPKDYIFNILGPGAIILGRTHDYNILCGQGVEIWRIRANTREKNKPYTCQNIYLRPSGDTLGSFYYYSLWAGLRLHRRRQTPLPMSQKVIDRVNYIVNKQNSPSGLTFTRQDGTSYELKDDELV